MRQERIDGRENYDEVRYQSIGRVSFGILLVVHTDRYTDDGDEVARVISARKATKQERREYETRIFNRRIVRKANWTPILTKLNYALRTIKLHTENI